MTYHRSKIFKRQYQKLPTSVKKKLKRHLGYLAKDIRHPALHARKMVNQEGIWEARIDQDYRFTFQIRKDTLILRKVGTHEIYRQP